MQDRVRNSWRRDLRTWRVSHVYGDFYSGYFPTKKLFFLLYRQESWNSKHGVKELLRTEPGLAQAPRPDTEFLHHRKPTVRGIQVHQWWPPFDDEMPPQRQKDSRKSTTAPLEILLQSLTRVVCILAAPHLKDKLIGWSSNRREETELSVVSRGSSTFPSLWTDLYIRHKR